MNTDIVPQYKIEFPDYDDDLTVPEGFEDASWRNDACPYLWSSSLRIGIYCDYRDRSLGDFGGEDYKDFEYHRFTVNRTDEHGQWLEDIASVDTWAEVEALIAKEREAHP